jgi:hypothetical protein
MKKILHIILTHLFLLTIQANGFAGEYREFRSKEGQSITARIIDYRKSTKTVRVERLNGKKAWVPITAFSADDEKYFKEWIAAAEFMSNERLAAQIKECKGDGESVQYEISLRNLTHWPYENLDLEYHIYIEIDKKAGSEPNYLRSQRGTLALSTLAPKECCVKKTVVAPLQTHYDKSFDMNKSSDAFGNERISLETKHKAISEEKPAGIWITISGPTLDGKKIERVICYPANLPKKIDEAQTMKSSFNAKFLQD